MQLNSYRFFQNKDCKYLCCHNVEDKENFNCLFCFCPLSCFEDCGGDYKILSNGWKDCSDCVIPHYDYDYIINKLRELHEKHGTFNKKGD